MGIVNIIGYAVVTIYTTTLVVITVYCLMQFHLLYHYLKKNKGINIPSEKPPLTDGEFPFVTIQLPIYNEKYVVERLIDNIVKLDYPKDRFEVHVLDDSTDESVEIAKKKVDEYRSQGFDIEHVRRKNRQGYKAGALKDAMDIAKGDFIAIFDADFLPNPDFLRKTMPHFKNESIGVVQTRWGHINDDYSILTRIQAFQLNVHFTVEQLGRKKGDYLLQFNGTAGIWRRECIDEAGGWEADTLTEDLDLSYRAQLKGWEIEYLEDIISPAELPAEMNGLKSQQYRWMKGGAETAVKVLPQVWRSDIGIYKKVYASMHLLSSSIFLFVFLLGVFSVPLTYFIRPLGLNQNIYGIFLIGLLSIAMIYYVANVKRSLDSESKLKLIVKFICLFPIFLALSMGLSLHNALAVLQGYLGKQSPFVRTPKFNINDVTKKINARSYLSKKISKVTAVEGLLAVYFSLGFLYGIYSNDLTFTALHLLLALGYSMIFYFSVKHVRIGG